MFAGRFKNTIFMLFCKHKGYYFSYNNNGLILPNEFGKKNADLLLQFKFNSQVSVE